MTFVQLVKFIWKGILFLVGILIYISIGNIIYENHATITQKTLYGKLYIVSCVSLLMGLVLIAGYWFNKLIDTLK